MTENNQQVIPVAINHFQNNDEIIQFVSFEILRLLTDTNILINNNTIRPADIAVLTRTNSQAKEIKNALSSLNIPSITIDEASILLSMEAQLILTLMNGVLQPKRGSINKILLNNVFGYKLEQISSIDDEVHLDFFREFRQVWYSNGIYNMLSMVFDKYNVRSNCLNNGIIGQRTLSNFYQLAELLHQKTLETKYSPEELIVWMQREMYNKSESYEQRIESEDNAVQISTVHKAKGLTYKIVFAPFLDLKIKKAADLFDFREDDVYKFTATPTDEQKELYNNQNEQENRRLIYVALTRAQYKNYICINTHFNGTSIRPFLEAESPLFELNVVKETTVGRYTPQVDNQQTFTPRPTPNIEIKNTFGIHSFSGLSRAHFTAPFSKEELNNDYDSFIFQTLGRGANVGTALHSIFERIDFNDPASWEQTIMDASKYYSNIIKEDAIPYFLQLVKEVMTTVIASSDDKFSLKSITNDKKLPELEFLFSVKNVNKAAIASVLETVAELNGEADIEGLMTGFIDLVFEHNGRYYILDWKSNHLGNTVESYNEQGMEQAMKGSNYHLQYLIYTLALKRYLAQKIPNFDYDKHFGGVIYVFLRGVRSGSKTGIFYKKPSTESINELDAIF
jgi:exodeoxyribonuclease V beta subunit